MGLLNRAASLLLAAVLLGSLCVGSTGWSGDRPEATGDELCALFVQRLVRYVTWPSGADPRQAGTLVVAATDARRIRPFFPEAAEGLRIRVVQWPVPACHVLLFNGTPFREAAAIVRDLAGVPVLTVGHALDCPPAGLVVNLRGADGRLKLEIDPAAARQAGLALSSRLLQIAVVINDD